MKTSKMTIVFKNDFGVLYRIIGVFLRRKVSIEALKVKKANKQGLTNAVIVGNTDKETMEKISRQLQHVIGITHISTN